MTTMIPPTEYGRMTRTNLSPETIVALLNEAEERFSPQPRHCNAKRRYPFWKACRKCGSPFQCNTKEQAKRNRYCSVGCRPTTAGRENTLAEKAGRVVACAVCGKEVWKPNARLKKVKKPTCSRRCNGALRGAEFAKHGHKGRAAWTEAAVASAREKMTGANNHAWKGGVTYFRKHGNYSPIKYVHCPTDFLAMARKDGYVMEHRLCVAQALGRPLERAETVHHVNHDPQDNRLENLMLFASNRDHKLYEAHGTPAPLWPK
jgi:hypothetical protein